MWSSRRSHACGAAAHARIEALFAARDRGATAVEYGLMLALIAGVIIGSVAILGGGPGGGGVLGLFQRVNWWTP